MRILFPYGAFGILVQRLVPCGDRVILWNREYMPKYYCAVAGFWCLWGENYSEVYAKISTVTMVVGAVSTPVLSAIYEASGSYLTAWIVCLVLSFVSTVCLMAACMGHDRVKD